MQNIFLRINRRNEREMTTCTTSFSATPWIRGKRAFYGFLGILALFMSMAFLTGCGKGQTEYEKGTAALEKGDYADAFKHFEKGADSDARAKLMLSQCYGFGIGVKENEGKADQLLEEAAAAGDEYAMYLWGVLLWMQDEGERGKMYLQRSADKGCVIAMSALSNCAAFEGKIADSIAYCEKVANQPLTDEKIPVEYLPGFVDNIKKAFNMAVKIGVHEEGALAGESSAVGIQRTAQKYFAFINGEEINEDFGRDIDNIDVDDIIKPKSPSITNTIIVFCQMSLGLMYAEGDESIGVKRDKEKAREWIKKAGENGLTIADEILKDI